MSKSLFDAKYGLLGLNAERFVKTAQDANAVIPLIETRLPELQKQLRKEKDIPEEYAGIQIVMGEQRFAYKYYDKEWKFVTVRANSRPQNADHEILQFMTWIYIERNRTQNKLAIGKVAEFAGIKLEDFHNEFLKYLRKASPSVSHIRFYFEAMKKGAQPTDLIPYLQSDPRMLDFLKETILPQLKEDPLIAEKYLPLMFIRKTDFSNKQVFQYFWGDMLLFPLKFRPDFSRYCLAELTSGSMENPYGDARMIPCSEAMRIDETVYGTRMFVPKYILEHRQPPVSEQGYFGLQTPEEIEILEFKPDNNRAEFQKYTLDLTRRDFVDTNKLSDNQYLDYVMLSGNMHINYIADMKYLQNLQFSGIFETGHGNIKLVFARVVLTKPSIQEQGSSQDQFHAGSSYCELDTIIVKPAFHPQLLDSKLAGDALIEAMTEYMLYQKLSSQSPLKLTVGNLALLLAVYQTQDVQLDKSKIEAQL